jgi:hypothetical protein
MKNLKQIHFNSKIKVCLSLIIGISSIVILTAVLSLFAWEDNFLRFLLPLKRIVYPLIGGTIWEFSSFFTSPLSFIGIFFGNLSLNSPERKLAILAIILNSINLLLSLFIAWALFGLARGM